MKLKDTKFYVLSLGNDNWVYTTESEAIVEMKKQVKAGNKSEENKLLEVDLSTEQWKITQVSWSKIAMILMEEE